MKKLIILGVLIFIISICVGYMYASFFMEQREAQQVQFDENNVEEYAEQNLDMLKTIEAVSEEEKVGPNTEFAIKKYYDECNHFNFEYEELPKELINLTRQEVDDYYNDEYEVENFENNALVISKEINGLCDNHFFMKLGNENIEIYKLNTDGSFALYKETEISREYLAREDIAVLEKGMYIYGEGKINATLEDFE